jgi:hypothetical protein
MGDETGILAEWTNSTSCGATSNFSSSLTATKKMLRNCSCLNCFKQPLSNRFPTEKSSYHC